jgi:dethiobiotin synthetase
MLLGEKARAQELEKAKMICANQPSRRPQSVVLVAGTGTDIGKTWTASRMIAELRSRQVFVQVRKPAQSFEANDATTDADHLSQASGEDPRTVCPAHRCYAIAMAPPMAADFLGRDRISVADLAEEVSNSWNLSAAAEAPRPAQIGLVESAGGPWSPIAHDGDGIDLARLMMPEVIILVADAGLGTINAIRPAVAELEKIAKVLVVLNRFDANNELHERNRAWLQLHYSIEASTSVAMLTDRLLSHLSGH